MADRLSRPNTPILNAQLAYGERRGEAGFATVETDVVLVFPMFLVFQSPLQRARFSRMEHRKHRFRITIGEYFRGSSILTFLFRLFEYIGMKNVDPEKPGMSR